MLLSDAIQEYLLEMQVRHFTQKTQRSYKNNLHIFTEWCKTAGIKNVEEIDRKTVKRFQLHEVKLGKRGTYINSLLKVLKAFLTYCYDMEYNQYDTSGFAWAKAEKPIIMAFTESDVRGILAAVNCRRDYIGMRDAAILTMLLDTGVRCWELCCIMTSDVLSDRIIIRQGKGRKERALPITAPLQLAMLKYNRVRAAYFEGKSTDDNYFLSFHGRALTNTAIEHLVDQYTADVSPGIRCSPHTFRHTFAQQQLKSGTDIYTLSRLLGHNSIAITQAYLQGLSDADIVTQAAGKSVVMQINS